MSSRFHHARMRLMILGGLVALVMSVGSFVAQAAAPAPKVCFYYSDDTFTELVGAHGTGCGGGVIDWGSISPYKVCALLHCPD
ncbi:MAG: hypothetical protein GEU99_24250 [Luteitalea sp.]|nr:hypothetical protein [Luteitalea sp.]